MITNCKFIGITHEIKKNGQINCKGSWIISSDSTSPKEAYDEAVSWSGKIGDFFRLPNTDDNDYIQDNFLKIHEINIQNIENNFTFQVDFFNYREVNNSITDGENNEIFFDPENPEQLILRNSKIEIHDSNYEIPETVFHYDYYGDYQNLSIPEIGEPITVNGKSYFCTSTEINNDENYTFSLKITASPALVEAKLVNEKIDSEKRTKQLKYFVNSAEAEKFISNFELNKTSPIGDEDYYLQSIERTQNLSNGIFIKLIFRKIKTEMLEFSREEYLSEFINGELPNPEVIFKSTWQVLKSDLTLFQNITGNSAESWAEPNSIVTKVIPKKISEIEYLIKVEAQLLSNSSLYKSYSDSSRYSLRDRTDYKVQWVDFKLTPLQCGYSLRQDSTFTPIVNWDAAVQCPFDTNTMLPINQINSISKLVQITEISYVRGSVKKNIEELINWSNPRVIFAKIASHKGSYLKTNLVTTEIFDNQGRKWTMTTKSYLLAPIGKTWSESYWKNKI